MNELLALYANELRNIRSTDFTDLRGSWKEMVPEELRDVWSSLTDETRLAVYLVASEAYLNLAD